MSSRVHQAYVYVKKKKKAKKKQVTSFIHHLFVIPEERGTVPNDSIVKQ